METIYKEIHGEKNSFTFANSLRKFELISEGVNSILMSMWQMSKLYWQMSNWHWHMPCIVWHFDIGQCVELTNTKVTIAKMINDSVIVTLTLKF